MKSSKSSASPWLILLLLLCFPGTAHGWSDQFAQALEFTKENAKSLPVSTNLLWITTGDGTRNPALEWRNDFDGQWRLKVVTWTRSAFAASYTPPNQLGSLSFGQSFVTVADELQDFFAENAAGPLSVENAKLRAAQLLGLPDTSRNDSFAEIWVLPEDLFRPTRDPSILTTTATATWPASDTASPDPLVWPTFDDYRNSFEGAWLSSVSSGDAANPYPYNYPFTGMGYTWDWANSPGSSEVIGLSEFVVQKNATYYTGSFVPTLAYVQVPEPGSMALLVIGCVVFVWRSRTGTGTLP